jgi:hypothetical protein
MEVRPMVSKPVAISGRTYETLGKAQREFSELRKSWKEEEVFTGTAARDIDFIYSEYCRLTSEPLSSPPQEYFVRTGPVETPIGFRNSRSYFVRFKDGTERAFSMDNALKEMANAS